MYLIHPAISVEIFRLGPLAIRWYSVMYLLGFLFFYWWTKREITENRIIFSKNGSNEISMNILSDVFFYAVLGILVGGRLGYVLFYNLEYFIKNPINILKTWEGGMSFHGAFICSFVFATSSLYFRKQQVRSYNPFDLSDIVLTSVPMGLALGRLGNFINGELYGRPAAVPWRMLFPYRPELGHMGAKLLPLQKVQGIIDQTKMTLEPNVTQFVINGQTLVQIPRHPSQLYHFLLEGIFALILQMFFYYKLPASKYRGFLTATFLILYGSARIFTEFFREPDEHIGFIFGDWLTLGIIYSLPMLICGIVLLSVSLYHKTPNGFRK
ncbi:MAG: prolipoprotein diacylglyceryl transferase [Brevinemataceae bacterium]